MKLSVAALILAMLTGTGLTCGMSDGADRTEGLTGTLDSFLRQWLVERSFDKAASYFGMGAVSPKIYADAIRMRLGDAEANYTNLLRLVAPSGTNVSDLRDVIGPPPMDAIDVLRNEAGAQLLNNFARDAYLIFSPYPNAYEELNGLRPELTRQLLILSKEEQILLVGFDFKDKSDPHYDGPLVLFWSRQRRGWKLIGIGGFPD